MRSAFLATELVCYAGEAEISMHVPVLNNGLVVSVAAFIEIDDCLLWGRL